MAVIRNRGANARNISQKNWPGSAEAAVKDRAGGPLDWVEGCCGAVVADIVIAHRELLAQAQGRTHH